MFDFSGKTVLITGASYGLGEGFAHGFADAGADLVLTARSADLLEGVAEVCRSTGSTVTVAPGDVSVEDDVQRVVSTAIEAYAGMSSARASAMNRLVKETQFPRPSAWASTE